MIRYLLAVMLLVAGHSGVHADDWARQEHLAREQMPGPPNLFPRQTWQPPPPPPAVQKTTAPPLPFQYLGQLQEGDAVSAFLAVMGQQIIAREGDVINGSYRVEHIRPGVIEMTYLPLNEKQSLSTGSNP